MITQSLKHLPPNSPLTFLEPSVGTGVFFSALLNNADKSRISAAVGCEIDAAYGDTANAIWSPLGLQLLHCDFLDFADNPDNFGKFNLFEITMMPDTHLLYGMLLL